MRRFFPWLRERERLRLCRKGLHANVLFVGGSQAKDYDFPVCDIPQARCTGWLAAYEFLVCDTCGHIGMRPRLHHEDGAGTGVRLEFDR